MTPHRIHLALVAGTAALALVACEARTTPAAPYVPPAAPLDIAAQPVPLPSLSVNDEQMADCIRTAPPRPDGQESQITGVRDETTDLFTSVRESIGGRSFYYSSSMPGQVTVDRDGMMIPETLPPGGLAANRAAHLGNCVDRANAASRPVELPTDEPIFQHQIKPQ